MTLSRGQLEEIVHDLITSTDRLTSDGRGLYTVHEADLEGLVEEIAARVDDVVNVNMPARCRQGWHSNDGSGACRRCGTGM